MTKNKEEKKDTNEDERRPSFLQGLREFIQTFGTALILALLIRATALQAYYIPSSSMVPTLHISDHLLVNKLAYKLVIPFTEHQLIQWSKPKRGDIVVFRFPGDPKEPQPIEKYTRILGPFFYNRQWTGISNLFHYYTPRDFIKRVVAIGGDRIQIQGNDLWINGKIYKKKLMDQILYPRDPITGDILYDIFQESLPGHPHRLMYEHTPKLRESFDLTVPPGKVFVMGDNRDNSHDSRFWKSGHFLSLKLIKGKSLVRYWPLSKIGRIP